MRQSSDQFADAMLSDPEAAGTTPSIAEQIAGVEKRLSEKLEASQKEFFEQLKNMQPSALNESVDNDDESAESNNDETNDVNNDEEGEN